MDEAQKLPGGGKLLSRRVKLSTVYIMLIICLVAVLLPMLYIARYDVPCADDYSYGADTHAAYVETGSIGAVLSVAVKRTVEAYYQWQGSYSAIFLMTLQPAIFGEQYYFLTVFVMLIPLLAGIFIFCRALFGKLFGADKYSSGILAVLIAVMCTQFVPAAAESYYWFNGAVYYTFYFGLALIAYGLILRYVLREGRSIAAAAGISLLLLFIAGGNYVTALSTAELLLAAAVLLFVLKNRKWKALLAFFAVFMAGFLFSALAPGNSVRQAAIQERYGVVRSILCCFSTTALSIPKWTRLPAVILLAFSVPISAGVCLRSEYRFRYPLLISLGSFCFIASMFCPPIYAVGAPVAGRIADIIFYMYIVLAVFNVFYWTGWLLRRYEKLKREPNGLKLWFIAAALVLFTVSCGFMASRQNVTSAYAAVAVANGGAERYYEAAQRRFALLNDGSVSQVEFPPYEYIPSVLFFEDITTDPGDWRNLCLSNYYGKDSVVITEPYGDIWG